MLLEIFQGFRHMRQNFHRVVSHGMRESVNGLVQRRSERLYRQLFEGVDQGVGKAVQSVAMSDDALTFYVVQDFAYLGGGELLVIKKRNEIGDHALEVDVVFPQS